MALAALLGVGLPVSAQAATAGPFPNPAPNSQLIPFGSLPFCSAVWSAPYLTAAAQLGWSNSPKVLLTNDGMSDELVPSLPCINGGQLSMGIVANAIVGSTMSYKQAGGWLVTFQCMVNGSVVPVTGGQKDPNALGFVSLAGDPPRIMATYSTYAGVFAADCPQLVGMSVTIFSGFGTYPDGFKALASWVWKPLLWTTGSGSWVPATTVNGVLPAGVELPIVCSIDVSGSDIWQSTQHFWTSVANWIPCMLIPVGWDRAGNISAAWASGPISELVNAYKSAVPAGIVCGAVGTIPFFGQILSLNTCGADFAPGWVKTVVGWVIVLGTCTVIVRRVMWSVGSRG